MPVINVSLSEDTYAKLHEEYKKMAVAWPKPGLAALPPSFDEWLEKRLATTTSAPVNGSAAGVEDLRIFTAIEKLITALQQYGFLLTRIVKPGAPLDDNASALAEYMVTDLKLPSHQLKRIEELIEYYAKDAKETADLAQVGVTGRTYVALQDAYKELSDRTAKVIERLGEERAVGRVEGAIAMLVSLGIMDRKTATEKTDAFKKQARSPKKWIG